MKRTLAGLLVGLTLASSAQAQMSADQNAQLNKALSNLNGANLQQGLAIATLMGCTEKQAGKPQTEAFYSKMQAVSKQVQADCKAQQPAQARALVIQTFRDNHNDPVVTAANNCYLQNQANIDALAGPQIAPQIGKYLRLLHNPDTIEQEVSTTDICKPNKPMQPLQMNHPAQ